MVDKKGKLIIIEGPLEHHNLGHSDLNYTGEDWLETNAYIPEVGNIANKWTTQSKKNALFCYRVSEHLRKGYDVILSVRKLEYLDKRLRDADIIIKLEHTD